MIEDIILLDAIQTFPQAQQMSYRKLQEWIEVRYTADQWTTHASIGNRIGRLLDEGKLAARRKWTCSHCATSNATYPTEDPVCAFCYTLNQGADKNGQVLTWSITLTADGRALWKEKQDIVERFRTPEPS